MKTVLLLALRGAPPTDVPQAEMGELLEQHAQLEQAAGPERGWFVRRRAELETRGSAGSPSAENDPFHTAAHALGEQLSRVTGCEVVVGFDHFGVPSLEEALEQAAISAKQVFVITPTLNCASQLSKVDLPRAIQQAQARHLDTPIVFR